MYRIEWNSNIYLVIEEAQDAVTGVKAAKRVSEEIWYDSVRNVSETVEQMFWYGVSTQRV